MLNTDQISKGQQRNPWLYSWSGNPWRDNNNTNNTNTLTEHCDANISCSFQRI